MVLTREEFAKYFNNIKPGLGDNNSPLWVPETVNPPVRCKAFVTVKPILDIRSFWSWSRKNLKGEVRCFSSNLNSIQWWGFTDSEDIQWFLLKWA